MWLYVHQTETQPESQPEPQPLTEIFTLRVNKSTGYTYLAVSTAEKGYSHNIPIDHKCGQLLKEEKDIDRHDAIARSYYPNIIVPESYYYSVEQYRRWPTEDTPVPKP